LKINTSGERNFDGTGKNERRKMHVCFGGKVLFAQKRSDVGFYTPSSIKTKSTKRSEIGERC